MFARMAFGLGVCLHTDVCGTGSVFLCAVFVPGKGKKEEMTGENLAVMKEILTFENVDPFIH